MYPVSADQMQLHKRTGTGFATFIVLYLGSQMKI